MDPSQPPSRTSSSCPGVGKAFVQALLTRVSATLNKVVELEDEVNELRTEVRRLCGKWYEGS